MENLMWNQEAFWDDTVYLFPLVNEGFAVIFDGHFSVTASKEDAIDLAKHLIATTDAGDALILHKDGKIGAAYDPDDIVVGQSATIRQRLAVVISARS
jgi:hypothetical protein